MGRQCLVGFAGVLFIVRAGSRKGSQALRALMIVGNRDVFASVAQILRKPHERFNSAIPRRCSCRQSTAAAVAAGCRPGAERFARMEAGNRLAQFNLSRL